MAAPALKTELTGTGKSSAFNMGFFYIVEEVLYFD